MFSTEELRRFSDMATERANEQAATEYPPGPKQDARACELMSKYYAQYVTPPSPPSMEERMGRLERQIASFHQRIKSLEESQWRRHWP